MKVITLNSEKFISSSHCLYEMAKKNFKPDILISIATGGDFIAKVILQKNKIDWYSVKKQRASTRSKNLLLGRAIMGVIKYFPYRILDILRVFEHQLLMRKVTVMSYDDIDPAQLSFDEKVLFGRKVLIVDDAVDTGSTLASVKKSVVNAVGSEENVKTAAIVRTFSSPIIIPDYVCYEMVLVRFPWSKDTKSEK